MTTTIPTTTPATTADHGETNAAPRSIRLTRADRLMNATARGLARLGISIQGTRILAVRGRRSGEWRTIVLNPITVDGVRYLVAPRGDTAWSRNLRAAGSGELRLGRTVEPFTATEVADRDKPSILRAYLEAYGWSAGTLRRPQRRHRAAAAASHHPVFRLA